MARAGKGSNVEGSGSEGTAPKRAGADAGGAARSQRAKKRKAKGPSANVSAASTPVTSQPGTPQTQPQSQEGKVKVKVGAGSARRRPKKPKRQAPNDADNAPPAFIDTAPTASTSTAGATAADSNADHPKRALKKRRQAARRQNRREARENGRATGQAVKQVPSRGISVSPFGIGEEEEDGQGLDVKDSEKMEQANGGPGPSTSAARARRSPSTAGQMEPNADFTLLDDEAPMGAGPGEEKGEYTPSAFNSMPRRSILTAIEDLPDLTLDVDVDGAGGTSGDLNDKDLEPPQGEIAPPFGQSGSTPSARTAFTHTTSQPAPSAAQRSRQARSMPGLATAEVRRGKVDKKNAFESPIASDANAPNGQEDAGAYTLRSDGLALPAYVEVDADGEVGQDQGDAGEVDDVDLGNLDGVYFVDSEISKGATRYFDPSANMDESNPDSDTNFIANADLSKLCRNCRKPGHHSQQCPHTVCALCGVVDEHTKPDCPFLVTCFNCGKPGHQQSECLEPKNKAWRCELCHMTDHRKFNCPTLWRIYTYYSPSDRVARQTERANATDWKAEALGRLADVDYCYNCAGDGHLGDDCPERRGSLMKPTQSAFSERIAATGPYASGYRSYPHSSAPRGEHYRFNESSALDGRHKPFSNAFTVGQMGREKQKEAHRRADRRAQSGARWEDLEEGEWPVDDRLSGMTIRGRGAAARGGRTGASDLHTPQQRNQRGAKRPWDSDSRSGTHTPNGDGYDSSGDRRNMPFGYAHLMSAPARNRFEHGATARNAGGNNGSPHITFGKISGHSMLNNNSGSNVNGGAQDTPTARGKGRQGLKDDNTWNSAPIDKGVAGRRLLVERALGIHSTPSSRRASPGASASPLTLGRGTETLGHGRTGTHGRPALGTETEGDDSFEMYDGPSPASGAGSDSASGIEQSRRKRQRQRRQPDVSSDADIDYEASWRRSGLGSNGRPSDWAAEEDREDKAHAAAERRAFKAQEQGGGKGKGKFGKSTVGQAAQRWSSQDADSHGSTKGKGNGRQGKGSGPGQVNDEARQGSSVPAQGKGQAKGPMYTGGY